jgi:hypothetical protein
LSAAAKERMMNNEKNKAKEQKPKMWMGRYVWMKGGKGHAVIHYMNRVIAS